MIRFVYVGDQVMEGNTDFSFWCTISDKYIEMDGETMFTSLNDYAECACHYVEQGDTQYERQKRAGFARRCRGMIPEGRVRAMDPAED